MNRQKANAAEVFIFPVVRSCAVPTSWIDNETAVTPSHSESLALHTEACDLALLEDIFQASKVLYLPDKFPLEVFSSADIL